MTFSLHEMCKNTGVFRHEILSHFNNMYRSCFLAESYSLCFLVKAIWFVLQIAVINTFWCDGMSFCLLRKIDCPINTIRLPRSFLMCVKFCTHVCNCSVKTELIGRNNYSKKSLNCFLIGTIVNGPFSVAFELTTGQSSLCTENRTSAHCEFQQHFVRDMVPNSFNAILLYRKPTLFQNLDQ